MAPSLLDLTTLGCRSADYVMEDLISTDWRGSLKSKAESLLYLLSILDLDEVLVSLFEPKSREDLLRGGPDESYSAREELIKPFVKDKEILKQVVEKLVDHSFVERAESDGRIVCNRYIQTAILEKMNPIEKWVTSNRLVFILNAAFPQSSDIDQSNNEYCKELSRYVFVLMRTFKQLPNVHFPLLLGKIAFRCAWFMIENEQLREASRITRDALILCSTAEVKRRLPGYSDGYSLSDARNICSYLAATQGSIEFELDTQQHGYEVLYSLKKMYLQSAQPGDVDQQCLGFIDSKLAMALMAEGRAEEALNLCLEAIKREESIEQKERVESDHDIFLANTCLCYTLLKQYDEAIKYNDQAMEMTEKRRGKKGTHMARVHLYRGNIHYAQGKLEDGHYDQGKLEDAFRALYKSYRIYQATLPKHRYTGLVAYKIGVITREGFAPISSIQYFHDALKILGYQKEHHRGAYSRTAFALASVLKSIGGREEAAKWKTLALWSLPIALEDSLSEKEEPSKEPEDYDKLVVFTHR